MGTVMEMIPNAFWSALNNQNLTDLLPPRWSILVNDAGVQVSYRETDFANISKIFQIFGNSVFG